MTGYLSIKNFERFQHYKDRAPPWIKFHASTLDDYEFSQLDDAVKAHLMLLWLLASKLGNRIPNDAAWIAHKIGARGRVDIKALLASGFLVEHDASGALAESEQDACLETEKRESREDISGEHASAPATEADFTTWWAAYPRKEGRADALKAYRAARKVADGPTLLTAAERYARQRRGEDPKFTKGPGAWLRAERWRDGESGQGPASQPAKLETLEERRALEARLEAQKAAMIEAARQRHKEQTATTGDAR